MFLAMIVYITMVVLPAVKIVGIVAAALTAFITVVSAMGWAIPYEDREKEKGRTRFFSWLKSGWLKVFVFLALLGAITPNEKVSWYIVGAYAAEKVATADTTKELASGAYDIFRDLVKKAKENIGDVDTKALQEKADKAFESASKVFDNASKTIDNASKT